MLRTTALLSALLFTSSVIAQRSSSDKQQQLVYVDKTGVLRYTKDQKEAVFFGVNYTSPFAYGYRSHKALGADLKKAIDNDVYHLSRLGIDAFRVHVWDTEITDAKGNLLTNEHLDLFDYLISKLKERNIRILLTPIAFWGNGYPEKDENTGSFSYVFGKGNAVVNDTAIRAQENYMKQFFVHVNPYTKLSYKNDPDIIATEINNEPHHSGPLAGATSYVNRLAAAIRSTGWVKPVFYNISESPYYAGAVANANIDGVSFQWYPTGLVANRTLQGNLLPNVDFYRIPFDTIPAFANKARMVYEFDAGDVLQPVMYPAMARSFRTAGFQWATQFAYDPMATAYANTEYQTHYLNLAYTPEKAISLLIAGKAFHQLTRGKSYGRYPADTAFGSTRISYTEQLSEWATPTEFYYTSNTTTAPLHAGQLEHIAGTGHSPVVQYNGTGAYFLDKVENGVWRLEVMPDVLALRDPFEKASLSKEVRRVQWNTKAMGISLPDLGEDFSITAVNEGNTHQPMVNGKSIQVYPGTYLLVKKGSKIPENKKINGVIALNEYVAPQPVRTDVVVNHQPWREVTAGQPLTIQATIAGIDSSAQVWVEGNRLGGDWFKTDMKLTGPSRYEATVPTSAQLTGLLQYRLIIRQGDQYVSYPGHHTGDPHAWDNYQQDTWETSITAPYTISLLNAATDHDIMTLPSYTKDAYIAGSTPGQLAIRFNGHGTKTDSVTGISRAVQAHLQNMPSQSIRPKVIVVRARVTDITEAQARIALVTGNGAAFAATFPLTNTFRDIEIPIDNFKKDAALLLPRPYPGFMPLWFKTDAGFPGIRELDKIEISNVPYIDPVTNTRSANTLPYYIEIESVWLKFVEYVQI